jgi:hypothetical protein
MGSRWADQHKTILAMLLSEHPGVQPLSTHQKSHSCRKHETMFWERAWIDRIQTMTIVCERLAGPNRASVEVPDCQFSDTQAQPSEIVDPEDFMWIACPGIVDRVPALQNRD